MTTGSKISHPYLILVATVLSLSIIDANNVEKGIDVGYPSLAFELRTVSQFLRVMAWENATVEVKMSQYKPSRKNYR